MSNIKFQESQAQPDLSILEKYKRDLNLVESIIKQKANDLNQSRAEFLSEQQEILKRLTVIQDRVLFNFLPRWKHEQQLANNGFETDPTALDQIQLWVEKITFITWRLRNQLKALQHLLGARPNVPFDQEQINKFGLLLVKSLETLIHNTFVVEKQPPQVMKTNTRFASTVRFLSGSELNIQMINPTVRVAIFSESRARAIIRHQKNVYNGWDVPGVAPLTPQREITPPVATVSPPQVQLYGQQQQPQSAQPLNQAYPSFSPDSQQPPVAPIINGPQQAPVTTQQEFFQQQHPPQQFTVSPVQQPQAMTPQQYTTIYQPNNNPYPLAGSNGAQNCYTQKVMNMNDFDPSGEILNCSNILEYQASTRQLLCHFRNMQLKKIKRTEKKGTECVMDEMFVLLFHSQFRIADPLIDSSNLSPSCTWIKQDLCFHIMAFSLPVVVIVHGNQEPHAWATVTWHNAFARPDDLLYKVPDKVSWRELGQVLSEKFRSCAGRGLSAQNLEYLGRKVHRGPILNDDDVCISWNQFAKEPLPEKQFTFWEWFHSILKLTKEHLRDLWNAERIFGFIGKQGCVDLLLGSHYHEPKPIGTFLMRFSETELGGITIAWVSGSSAAQSERNSSIKIMKRSSPASPSASVLMHLQPFVSKDLSTRSLADRIRDLEDLVTLYPDRPKDEAFRSYYAPLIDTTPLSNGYIRPMLIQTLVTKYPKNSASNSTDCANTPNSMSQSSPECTYQDHAFMNEMDTYPSYDQTMSEFNSTIQ